MTGNKNLGKKYLANILKKKTGYSLLFSQKLIGKGYDSYIQKAAGEHLLSQCAAQHCTEELLGNLDQEGQDALYGLACPTINKGDQRTKLAEELGCKLPETCGFLGMKCLFKRKCTEEELGGTAAALLYSLPQPQYCPL